MNQTAFAEIIESSLHSFVAQSWQWNTFPPFGSFVAVKNGLSTIYAVVHQVQTGSMDPQRTPFTYQKTEEELLAEQPQIFAFLKTTFTCTILGYSHKGAINYTISPEPAKIHAFVRPLTSDELKTFLYHDTYLHTLFSSAQQICNLDELLLAIFKQHQHLDILTKQKLHQLIETFSLLTGNDYRRLKLFLQRVDRMIQTY
jgi:hypothetical protein